MKNLIRSVLCIVIMNITSLNAEILKINTQDGYIEVAIESDDTVEDIKAAIEEQTEIPASLKTLKLNGETLDDDEQVDIKEIQRNPDSLQLEVEE